MVERFGGFDTWVNNAVVGIIGAIEQTSTADHHKIFETNYFGMVYGSLEAVRYFRESGRHGALINLGSVVSDIPIAMSVAYGATKHAIKGFTEGLRIELARDEVPVSVTLVKPSGIDTPFFDHAHTLTAGLGKAPGPNYAPSVVADAIVHAAQHVSRDLAVGATAASAAIVEGTAPQIFDAMQRSMPIDSLIDPEHEVEDDNLHRAAGPGRERSRFGSGRSFSLTTKAQMAPRGLSVGAVVLAVGLGALLLSTMRTTARGQRR